MFTKTIIVINLILCQILRTHNWSRRTAWKPFVTFCSAKKNTEINDRFVVLEQSMRESIERVEERINNRFESLDQFLRAEMESAHAEIRAVEEKVRAEAMQRESDDRNLGDVVAAFKSNADERFLKGEKSVTELRDTLRAEIFDHTKRLSDEIGSARRELLQRIESDIEQLTASAADRKELGNFLIDLGMRVQPGDHEQLIDGNGNGNGNGDGDGDGNDTVGVEKDRGFHLEEQENIELFS